MTKDDFANSIQRSSRQLLLQEEKKVPLPYTQLLKWFLLFHEELPQDCSETCRVFWLRLPWAEGGSGMEWDTLHYPNRD